MNRIALLSLLVASAALAQESPSFNVPAPLAEMAQTCLALVTQTTCVSDTQATEVNDTLHAGATDLIHPDPSGPASSPPTRERIPFLGGYRPQFWAPPPACQPPIELLPIDPLPRDVWPEHQRMEDGCNAVLDALRLALERSTPDNDIFVEFGRQILEAVNSVPY